MFLSLFIFCLQNTVKILQWISVYIPDSFPCLFYASKMSLFIEKLMSFGERKQPFKRFKDFVMNGCIASSIKGLF